MSTAEDAALLLAIVRRQLRTLLSGDNEVGRSATTWGPSPANLVVANRPRGLTRDTLRFGLEEDYPEENWGFTAQQAAEKRLKALIVLADRRPPRLHDLKDLAALAEQPLDPRLAALRVFAVEARHE